MLAPEPMLRPSRTILIGITVFGIGLCLPDFVKLLRNLGAFGGAWGGFGLFVIAIHLRPWLAGCGALAILVGAFVLRRRISN